MHFSRIKNSLMHFSRIQILFWCIPAASKGFLMHFDRIQICPPYDAFQPHQKFLMHFGRIQIYPPRDALQPHQKVLMQFSHIRNGLPLDALRQRCMWLASNACISNESWRSCWNLHLMVPSMVPGSKKTHKTLSRIHHMRPTPFYSRGKKTIKYKKLQIIFEAQNRSYFQASSLDEK